jgi:hypothetical protein
MRWRIVCAGPDPSRGSAVYDTGDVRLKMSCVPFFIELGEIFGGVFVEGADAAFAAETEEAIAVEGIDGVIEFIFGNEADLEWVGGGEGLGLGFFLGGFGDEGLEGGLAFFFLLREGSPEAEGRGEKGVGEEVFHRRRRPPLEE